MIRSSTLGALEGIVAEIRAKGHFGNCRKNTSEYADWCAWIEGVKEKLLAFESVLDPSIADAAKGIEYDWEDWVSVGAAIERIHALSYLIEDEVELARLERASSGKLKAFETVAHSYARKSSIGNGGAGNVYLVERDDGDSFALKLLNKQSCGDGNKVRRFLREAAFCTRHSDAPLVRVVDQGFRQETNLKQPFYVMPLYEGSLRKLMDDPGADRSAILGMLFKLLDSLKGFYDGGHVHRDIKPENILFDDNSNCLILADFGVAHINEDLPELTLQTKSAERLANFRYAAPEQRITNGEVDHRADQFAFGLIINELFTGAIPQGSGYTEIASRSEQFAYLDPVVEKMISQNRADRYESISVLLADVEARERIQGVESRTRELDNRTEEPFEVLVVSKEWVEPNLVFNLNMVPDRRWAEAFRSYTGMTSFSTDGFYLDPQHFIVSGSQIIVPNTRGDKRHLTDACQAMPSYVRWANEVMGRRIEKESREAHEALVRAREEEIKRRESSADINSFLASL